MTTERSRGILIVGLLIVVGFVMIVHSSGRKVAPSASVASTDLNQKAVGVVSYTVIDDVQGDLHGINSLSAHSGIFLPLLSLDTQTTAGDYEAAYDANEISAEDRFKGKKVLLSGTVVSIEKDFTDEGYVVLRGAGLMGIHARLSAEGSTEAAAFKKGQKVHLVCEGSGRIVTVATLTSCETFEGYRDQLSPSLGQTISNFLLGRTPLRKDAAAIITTIYISALSMPPDSACLNGATQSCEAELKTLFADESKKQLLASQSDKMMATLKVF